jgi:hypothetical protein
MGEQCGCKFCMQLRGTETVERPSEATASDILDMADNLSEVAEKLKERGCRNMAAKLDMKAYELMRLVEDWGVDV